jgi:hypothetical protein
LIGKGEISMSKNIIFDKYGYYAYIGVFKEKDYECSSLILDTNTAINVENFYYKPNKMDERKRKATLDFLSDNISIDFVPGLAMEEACWDFSLKGINQQQLKKMENAFNNIYRMNVKDLELHSKGQGGDLQHFVQRNPTPQLSSLIDQLEANPVLVGTYATVLKIMILQKKEKNKLKAIEKYIDFVKEKLFVNHAIETNIAINYFLGTPKMQEIGDKIFKFGKKNPLFNAWNTSWDIFFLRYLQKMYYEGLAYDIIKPKLVTSDQGLIRLAEMTSLEAVIQEKNNIIPVISFYDSDIRQEFINEASKIEKDLRNTFYQRRKAISEIENITDYVKSLIRDLEMELLSL